MQTDIRYFPHLYRDSVALMRLSADLAARPGVDQASLLMGTPANMDLLVDSGLVDAPPPAAPGDIVFVARGEPDALAAAYEAAGQALTQGESRSGEEGGEGADVPASLLDAVRAAAESSGAESSGGDFGNASEDAGEARLALISTPGEFAGAEALKALRAGLHTLIFSDNVPLEQEKDLKREARERHLLVMGPDCGTAIVGGVPLAFANVVRRGDIGVVGASGTGIQQITCLIDRLGGGVSHALGTGSRDVSAEVGGLSMLAGLDALAADPGTRVIVLAAKPPAPEVARRVLDAARTCGKPGGSRPPGRGSGRRPSRRFRRRRARRPRSPASGRGGGPFSARRTPFSARALHRRHLLLRSPGSPSEPAGAFVLQHALRAGEAPGIGLEKPGPHPA